MNAAGMNAPHNEGFVVVSNGKVRSRHASAMEAELESARLRSFGFKAFARDVRAYKQRHQKSGSQLRL